MAGESAGQCGPCAFGLAAIADGIDRLAEGRSADPGLLRRWLGQVDGRGGCAHPSGAVRLVRDDWGFPIISDQPVPSRLVADARTIARACPKLALRLERPCIT